jgi:hypothetical protein
MCPASLHSRGPGDELLENPEVGRAAVRFKTGDNDGNRVAFIG